jgi:SAM-dependent methyltransferase
MVRHRASSLTEEELGVFSVSPAARSQGSGEGAGRPGRDPKPERGRAIHKIAPLAPNAWLRYDAVERMLPAGVTDVAEIGCGRGAFGARLAQRYSYLGVEPDRESWAVAKARIDGLGRGEVRNVSSSALSGQRFDLVCAFEVLEHIENDADALSEWARLLRPGGWLLLSVPAHQRRFGPWDELVGHFRRYDERMITRLLDNAGFTDITVRLYGFPLGYLLEPVRNAVGRRRLAAAAGQSQEERTSGSGRQLQPSGGALGAVVAWVTIPFRLLQRATPKAGTGLVVRARLARQPETGS